MKENIVISAMGRDCPGIVAAVSKVLFEAGCNLEDSSMTILEGEFAMILVVSLPEGLKRDDLDRQFDQVRKKLELAIFLKPMTQEETRRHESSRAPYMLSVYGADKPGIVYQVTQLLAGEKVNITDVNTRRVVEEGTPTYMMMLELEMPPTIKLNEIKKKLEEVGNQLAVNITLRPIETLSL